jgi:hypothetical protein
MILFAPVGILGVAALTLVVGFWILPPFYVVVLVYCGDYFWAALALISWGLWFRFGGPVRRFVSEGWGEYGGL